MDKPQNTMKVTTKYNLRDKVWYMSQNRPQCGQVTYVYIRITGKDKYNVSYHINHDAGNWTEDLLFDSKQELLETL